MSDLIITTGAITTAMRLKKQLNNAGDINARVIHTPSEINSGGCSYSVKTSFGNLIMAREIISKMNIKIRRMYIEEKTGGGSVYNVIS